MSSTKTVQTKIIPVGSDTVQLKLLFNIAIDGISEILDTKSIGVKIKDWGEFSMKYDLEDALLVPALYSFSLYDSKGYIDNLLFGFDSVASATSKTVETQLFINGTLEFDGYFEEDQIIQDDGDMSINISASPLIDILNKTSLFDDSGNPINPMNFNTYNVMPFTDAITKAYQLVNPNISLDIQHDWDFQGVRSSDGSLLDGIKLSELSVYAQKLIYPPVNSNFSVSGVGDFLKLLTFNFCGFTGMLSYDKAFFKKLLHYDASNLQTLGSIYGHKKFYKYQLLDYVKITADCGVDSSSKRVLASHECGDPKKSNIADKTLIRSVPFGFYYDNSSNSYQTQTMASVNRGDPNEDGAYYVYRVRDPLVLSGQYSGLHEVAAEFWYYFRNSMQKLRIDEFTINDLKPSFTKDFNEYGLKFQILSMTKKIGIAQTVIDAVCLGM